MFFKSVEFNENNNLLYIIGYDSKVILKITNFYIYTLPYQ